MYTIHDTGCWADGAFGEAHRREKMALMIEQVGARSYGLAESDRELCERLRSESSDDYAEEDEALERLQAHTEDGAVWVLECGDLILATEDCEAWND